MTPFYMSLLQSLEAQGAQNTGYAATRDDALVWLGPPPASNHGRLDVAITCKTFAEELPALPPAFQELINENVMELDRRKGTIVFSLPGDVNLNPQLFLQNLDYFIAQLNEGGILPSPRCNGCMETKNLTVVPHDGKAVRICPDCDKRRLAELQKNDPSALPPTAREQSTHVSAIKGNKIQGGGSQVARKALSMLSLVLLIATPVTFVLSFFLWALLWSLFDGAIAGMAGDDGTVSAPWIVWLIVGCIIGAITSFPLGINFRMSRIGEWIPSLLVAIPSGIAVVAFGEAFYAISIWYAETQEIDLGVGIQYVLTMHQEEVSNLIFKVVYAGIMIACLNMLIDPRGADDPD